MTAIDAAPPDATIATDGRHGEAYAITADGLTAIALNTTTVDFIGGPSIAVSDLRTAKAEQDARRRASEPTDAPPGTIGGLPTGTAANRWPYGLWWGLAGVGVLAVAAAAFLLGRTSRSARVESEPNGGEAAGE